MDGCRRGKTISETGRSQSETLGFVLLFSILIIGAGIILVLGSAALDNTEQQLSDDRAEQSLTQFASKAGLVALDEADSQRLSLATGAGEQFSVESDRGEMTVTVENRTDAQSEFTVMETTLGAVLYDRGNSRVAYQGGGVWRANEAGGSMVSPPEFHFRNGTLTLPAVVVQGEGNLNRGATITQNGTDREFPRSNDDQYSNPLDNHLVTVTVQSEFYRGWGQYFEERTDGEVDFDHENETVELVLVTPVEQTEVDTASSSLAASGNFNVSGTSASRCDADTADDIYSDSYDSSAYDKGYCDQLDNGTTGFSGDIIYGGDLDISAGAGGSDFCGNIVSGGAVTTDGSQGDPDDGTNCGDGGGGQPTVYGHINYTDSCTNCESAIADVGEDWEVNRIDGIDEAAPIGFYVENEIDRIEEEEDERNPDLSGTTTFESGTYYFDSLELEEDAELILNTSGGKIDIGVRENVVLNESATMQIEDEGNVRLFVGGETVGTGDHLRMDEGSTIQAPNDDATQFRLYGTEVFSASIGEGSGTLAKFNGVIYAPPSPQSDGIVSINDGEVYGGMLVGTTEIPNGGSGSIHYDEALRDEQIIDPDAGAVTVTFLHVTTNYITIEDG